MIPGAGGPQAAQEKGRGDRKSSAIHFNIHPKRGRPRPGTCPQSRTTSAQGCKQQQEAGPSLQSEGLRAVRRVAALLSDPHSLDRNTIVTTNSPPHTSSDSPPTLGRSTQTIPEACRDKISPKHLGQTFFEGPI